MDYPSHIHSICKCMYTCRCMCAGCMCQGPISTYLSYLITLTIANPARCWSFHRMPFVSLHFHCLRFFYSPPSFLHSVKISQCSIQGPTVHLSVQMCSKTSNGKKTLTHTHGFQVPWRQVYSSLCFVPSSILGTYGAWYIRGTQKILVKWMKSGIAFTQSWMLEIQESF